MTSAFLGSNMLRLAYDELKKFLNEIDECLKVDREPIFTAELGFSKDGTNYIINIYFYVVYFKFLLYF